MASRLRRFIQIVRNDGMKSALNSTLDFIRYKKNLAEVSEGTNNAIHMYYDQEKNRLTELCDEYGTDKGELTSDSNPYPWKSHNYTDFYSTIFKQRRDSVESLLECGIGTTNTDVPGHMGPQGVPGASLRVWRDYFPNAEVSGIDIDDNVLFSENRIETYCVDQTSADDISQFMSKSKTDKFDIIIDDGLHEYHANITLFENMIDHLSKNGVYIIEDVTHHNLKKYKRYFIDELNTHHAKIVEIENSRISGRDRVIMITSE